MNPTLFAQILVRVLAIYLMAEAIMVAPQIASFPFTTNAGSEESNIVYRALGLAFLMPLLVGILLWAFASKISTLVVGRKSTLSSDSPLTTSSVASVAISVAGLLIVIIYLPSLVSAWVQYDAASETFNADKLRTYLLAQGARVFLGVLLFVGVRYWVSLINHFREFGLEK